MSSINSYRLLLTLSTFIQLNLGNDYMINKPDYLQSCQFSDPEFVKCSTKSVQQLIDQVRYGIEGLETLPAVDPMKINKLRIFQGSGPVSINASLSKVTITGFSNTKVKESKVDSKNFNWETHFHLPKMRLDGFYEVKGRILIIPLNGHGKLWIEASNMDVVMYTKTKLYEKHNHVFYNVTEAKVDYNVTGLRLKLDNLFDGLKALEESTNQYLNNNWRPAAEALKPVITKTIENILLGLLQNVFHFLPADYLITDIPKPKLCEINISKIEIGFMEYLDVHEPIQMKFLWFLTWLISLNK